MTLMRYPGSKDRATGLILDWLDLSSRSICEPFTGTAAVTFAAIDAGLVDRVHLNDRDRGIADLWSTVLHNPGELVDLVNGYTPDVADFYRWRGGDLDDRLENAFATLAVHQMSYSGLGRVAGSPIGGEGQTGDYLVDVRWSPHRLSREIIRLNRLLSRVDATVTCNDWSSCPIDPTWFVDPPYVDVGPGLYRFGVIDHDDLAAFLKVKPTPWTLTYNDVAAVRQLYSWAYVQTGMRTYLNHGGAAAKVEVLITPTSHPVATLF